MNPIVIGEMPITSKWHVSQWVEQGGISSLGKPLENISEFRKGGFVYVQADRIALFWGSGGMQPVRCRNIYGATDQPGIDHFVVLLWGMLSFHRRVANPGESELPSKAGVVKCHRLSTIPSEKKIGCEFHKQYAVPFPFDL